MLSCRAVAKTYRTERGDVAAVRGVDLDVAAGRFVAIIGRSGSGKSTLMAMIGGLSRPTAGRIEVEGTDLWSLPDAGLASFRNRRVGYVFQFASLLPTLRLADNVALPALLDRREATDAIHGRAVELLGAFGLGDHLDTYPSEVSAGEQRRAAIARALINRPALVLADEPTADLDEETEREIMAALGRVNREHAATLVLVTHNLALAETADEVVHVADGMIVR